MSPRRARRTATGQESDAHGFSRNLDDRKRKRGLSRGAEMRLLDHRPDHVLLRSRPVLRRRHPRCDRRAAQMGAGGQPAADRGQREGAQVLRLHLRAQSLHPDPVVVLRQDLRHPAQRQALSRQPGAAADAEIRRRGRRSRGRRSSSTRSSRFRRFLLFARDTIRWRRPMEPDIHWSAMSGHVSTYIVNGGRYDHIFWTEDFNDGMQGVLDRIETPVHGRPEGRSRASTKAKATGRSARIRSRTISTTCRCI